jgi:hypothetical protein
VPEFLSPAWLEQLDVAVRAAADLAADPPFVVETRVHRPDGDTGYQVRFGADGATVAIVGTAPADVVLITDDATARALHDGTRRAQDAFARGELKVRGRLELLTGRADLFARLADAVAPVRAGTTSGVDR